jgi:myb proto-oncogene protein
MQKLREAVKKHGKKEWVTVAAMVPCRTNMQCRHRWVNKVDPANGKSPGKWTPEEDAKLTKGVKKHGNEWAAVAAMVPGRTNLQCRERWVNTVDPTNVKSAARWTPEEDAKLTGAVKKHGNEWVAVSALVPGRTDKQCRQRWVHTLDPANVKKGK